MSNILVIKNRLVPSLSYTNDLRPKPFKIAVIC